MNFCFPDKRALCMAENATHNLHNLLTLRGAEVRDPRIWSRYLAEAIELFAAESDVAFASHHWPTWGTAEIVDYLTQQRDLYAYLHDQTLRLINQGYIGSEIAEVIELPPDLDEAWHTHGYYGSANHNVKAIYQRYLGWYDGNPAHLWQHPAAGGRDPVRAGPRRRGRDRGQGQGLLRRKATCGLPPSWPATPCSPTRATARPGTCSPRSWSGWATGRRTRPGATATSPARRNCGPARSSTPRSAAPGLAPALTITQLFDSIAIRINGPKAWGERLSIGWHFTDAHENYRMELSHGALTHYPTTGNRAADLTVTLTKPQLLQLLATAKPGGIDMIGDPAVLGRLMSLIDNPDPDFAIVTP